MDNSQDTWNKLYREYIKTDFNGWEDYYSVKMKLKRPFLKLIAKYADKEKPVLECGSGTGKFAAYLASIGYDSYAMDLELAMVEQAKELSERLSPDNPVKVVYGDIQDIPFPDSFFTLTHSSGVLEHYDDERIISIINEQLRVADVMIFSVPSPYFEKKMLGNERFMRRDEWRRIIAKSRGELIEESGYHYKPLKTRLIDIIKKPSRLLKPVALFSFVVRRKIK